MAIKQGPRYVATWVVVYFMTFLVLYYATGGDVRLGEAVGIDSEGSGFATDF